MKKLVKFIYVNTDTAMAVDGVPVSITPGIKVLKSIRRDGWIDFYASELNQFINARSEILSVKLEKCATSELL